METNENLRITIIPKFYFKLVRVTHMDHLLPLNLYAIQVYYTIKNSGIKILLKKA